MQQNMFFLDFMNNGLIIVWNRKYCEERGKIRFYKKFKKYREIEASTYLYPKVGRAYQTTQLRWVYNNRTRARARYSPLLARSKQDDATKNLPTKPTKRYQG